MRITPIGPMVTGPVRAVSPVRRKNDAEKARDATGVETEQAVAQVQRRQADDQALGGEVDIYV